MLVAVVASALLVKASGLRSGTVNPQPNNSLTMKDGNEPNLHTYLIKDVLVSSPITLSTIAATAGSAAA